MPPGLVYDATPMSLRWNYAIKNFGKSTAFGIKGFEYISVLGGHFRGMKKREGATELVPTQLLWATARYDDFVTPQRADLALHTDDGVIVKVIVKYKDAYGTIYHADICLVHAANGTVPTCDLSKIATPTDNDSDEKNYN